MGFQEGRGVYWEAPYIPKSNIALYDNERQGDI